MACHVVSHQFRLQVQNREWDSGKPGAKRSPAPEPANPAGRSPVQAASIGIRGGSRRGAGRGRGGGGAVASAPVSTMSSMSNEPPDDGSAVAAAV